MTRSTQHEITPIDLRNIMSGEGGVDLERIVENGKQVAMRVVGVSPGTTAARIGAQNGDTIETINDMPLSSVAEAYRIAAAVAKEPEIVIKGSRAGEPYVTTLRFRR
jgi:S1-C subfamily serine protease